MIAEKEYSWVACVDARLFVPPETWVVHAEAVQATPTVVWEAKAENVAPQPFLCPVESEYKTSPMSDTGLVPTVIVWYSVMPFKKCKISPKHVGSVMRMP